MYSGIDYEKIYERLYFFSQQIINFIITEAEGENDALIEWLIGEASDEQITSWYEEAQADIEDAESNDHYEVVEMREVVAKQNLEINELKTEISDLNAEIEHLKKRFGAK